MDVLVTGQVAADHDEMEELFVGPFELRHGTAGGIDDLEGQGLHPVRDEPRGASLDEVVVRCRRLVGDAFIGRWALAGGLALTRQHDRRWRGVPSSRSRPIIGVWDQHRGGQRRQHRSEQDGSSNVAHRPS
jgi:hypothetical protein